MKKERVYKQSIMEQQIDRRYQIGEIIVGTVVALTQTGASIEIGNDLQIDIPLAQISRYQNLAAAEVLEIGETRAFEVVLDRDAKGELVPTLSVWIFHANIANRRIQQLLAERNLILAVKVIDSCHEGMIVELEGSLQLIPTWYLKTDRELRSLIGETIAVRFIEVGLVPIRENNTVKFVDAWVLSYGIESLEYVRIGDIISGTVTQIEEDGAWINIGSARHVYIPKSRISRTNINIAEYLPLGTTREFIIANYYIERPQFGLQSNISLSIIDLESAICQQRLAQMQAENVTIQAQVSGYDRRSNSVFIAIDNSIGSVNSISLGKIYPDRESIEPIIPLKVIDSDRKIFIHPDVLNWVKSGKLFLGTIVKIYPSAYLVEIDIGKSILHQCNIFDRSELIDRTRFKIGDRMMVKIIIDRASHYPIQFATVDSPHHDRQLSLA
jgi:ribosomal protein S1